MRYQFLVGTYETERLKVLSVWSMFRDGDLPIRPHATDTRGRSVLEQMVHQWSVKTCGSAGCSLST